MRRDLQVGKNAKFLVGYLHNKSEYEVAWVPSFVHDIRRSAGSLSREISPEPEIYIHASLIEISFDVEAVAICLFLNLSQNS
jgi:hypothetical protein